MDRSMLRSLHPSILPYFYHLMRAPSRHLHRLEILSITTKSGKVAAEAEGEHVALLIPYPPANFKCRVEFNVEDPEDFDLVVLGSTFTVAEATLAKFSPDNICSLFEVIEEMRALYKMQKMTEAETEKSVLAANDDIRALVEVSIAGGFEVCAKGLFFEYAVKLDFRVAKNEFDPPELEATLEDTAVSAIVKFILSSSGSPTFRSITPTKSLSRLCGSALKALSVPAGSRLQEALLSLHQDISSMLEKAAFFKARRSFVAHLFEQFGDSIVYADYLHYNSVKIEVSLQNVPWGFVELCLDAFPKHIEMRSFPKDGTGFRQEPPFICTSLEGQLESFAAVIKTFIPNACQAFIVTN